MKQLILKYKASILLALGVLIFIIFLLSQKSTPLPQITSLTPSDGSNNVDLRAVPTYVADKALLLSDVTISSSPAFEFKLTSPDSVTILATHPLAFQPATTYALTLSWQGHLLQSHTFTTIKSQEDPLLIQSMNEELARDYPLAQKLPYTTSQYRVVYSAPMTLEITLKNPNLTSQEAIDDIRTWVAKNGGDVSAHKYVIAP